MSGFNYMDCYFEFQKEFKPVENYSSLEDIVESALTKLVKVLDCYSSDKFVQNIKLIYPNYFTEKKDHCFEPIKDDLICFNNPDEELKERVLQHMSYYMTGKDTKFMRISKTLLENEKLNIKNFLVKKASKNYEVSINGEIKKPKLCKPSQQFPVDIVESRIKGSFIEENISKAKLTICKFIAASGEQQASPEDLPEEFKERGINDVGDFVQIFESPLSAHYIMLQKTSLLYVYSQTAQIDKNKSSLGYGGMFILISAGLKESNISKYICFFQLVSDYISICIAHNIMRAKQKKEAEKSAKAAIMSRNMSHNLGSHVMAYLKQHLGSVKEMLRSNVLSSLVEEENYVLALIALSNNDITSAQKLIESTIGEKQSRVQQAETTNVEGANPDEEVEKRADPIENVALPFLVGLGQFISYLQERQDFIATIATDFVPYFSTVNFKDFIYDEINNDKRYERHPDRQNLKPDNILLGNIARSEGLGRETCPTSGKNKTTLGDIILKFRSTFTGDPVEIIAGNKQRKAVNPLNYYNNNQRKVNTALQELNEMRKYDFSLPGGVVGRQAIFSIIENVIRNAAKHGNWREKNELEVTIDILSKDDIRSEKVDGETTYYRQLSEEGREVKMVNDAISKNHLSLCEVLDRFYFRSKDADDIYIVTLTDNLMFSEDDLAKLRMAIAENYVDKEGKMKEANKGIKEMRISASWLRSITDERKNRPLYNEQPMESPSLENLKYDTKWTFPGTDNVAPVLYARITKDGKEEHLQYIFCIVKPQKVALISSGFEHITDDYPGKRIFCKNGWKIFTPDAFLNNKNKNFDYIIFDDECDTRKYIEVRRHSHSLFFKLSKVHNELKPIKEHIMGDKPLDDRRLRLALNKTFKKLGEKLASWNNHEKILILDDRSKSNYDNDTKISSKERLYLEKMISFRKEDPNVKYRYVTHLESKKEFQYYVIKQDDASRFVFSEGITGNNSTDRLLRNETINAEWFYRHLYVMKQKVAIFDERLFSKAFGLEETDFVIPKMNDFGKNIDKDKKSILKLFPDSDKYIKQLSTKDELKEFLMDPDCYDYNPLTGKDKQIVACKHHLGATYAAKGVYIFSIIRSIVRTPDGQKCFNLYGYQANGNNGEAFSQCHKFAEIYWNPDVKGLFINPMDGLDDSILHDFNFISIHQGLLDKMYEAFDIKNDKQAKENLTHDFYLYFSPKTKHPIEKGQNDNQETDSRLKEFTLEDSTITHYFLPGMSIHSGRSKPAEHDMPQLLPFIPYSAIEHAVLDCKYSLVKLLNTARYE